MFSRYEYVYMCEEMTRRIAHFLKYGLDIYIYIYMGVDDAQMY